MLNKSLLKRLLTVLLLSTMSMLALESGESIPQNIQNKLNMQSDTIYILDFFASWCKSCKKELPLVEKVFKDKVVEVIGINVDKKKEDGEKMVSDLALSFPIHYDSDKTLVEAFDPLGFPAVYYVKNGKILHVIFGAVDEIDQQITKDIEGIK